jgi:uncharacterized protein
MRLHQFFEWDESKAVSNLGKHGVSFDDAARVLADPDGEVFHVEEFDETHQDIEDRYITTAFDPDDRQIILRISWTDRSRVNASVTRIISARVASERERAKYFKEIFSA